MLHVHTVALDCSADVYSRSHVFTFKALFSEVLYHACWQAVSATAVVSTTAPATTGLAVYWFFHMYVLLCFRGLRTMATQIVQMHVSGVSEEASQYLLHVMIEHAAVNEHTAVILRDYNITLYVNAPLVQSLCK